MTHKHGRTIYHPSPFGDDRPHVRADCAKRYTSIRVNCGDIKGKTVLDFGCAEGYFGLSFLRDGAKECTFIDTDESCLKVVDDDAVNNGVASKCKIYPSLASGSHFDIGLCLDLWSEAGVPRCKDFAKLVYTLFISTSGNGYDKNMKLVDEACKSFEEVIPITSIGYEGRLIYRCRN